VNHREGVKLREQPFDTRKWRTTFVRYRSLHAAFRFLGNILTGDRGIGLLHGPRSSGKTVLVRHFVRELQKNVAIAVVDGTGLKAPQLLSEILEQFGYGVKLNSTDELLNMLTVIAVQQTRSHRAPVLVVENINNMYPSTLRALCELASQMVHGRYALRIVLVGNRRFGRIIDSPSMSPIAERLVGDFELQPLTAKETLVYLYTKLQSCGVSQPSDYFSTNFCTELHEASGGWPGSLDDIFLSIIDQARNFPIRREEISHPAMRDVPSDEDKSTITGSPPDQEPPKLVITHHGKTLDEIDLISSRAVIGRSELSDLVIDADFVSRQHALLIRDQSSVIIVDLKSRNGTFVNSRRVSSKILQDSDIISIGHHRIKLIYPAGFASANTNALDIDDTATMKGIADARQAKLGLVRVDARKVQAKD